MLWQLQPIFHLILNPQHLKNLIIWIVKWLKYVQNIEKILAEHWIKLEYDSTFCCVYAISQNFLWQNTICLSSAGGYFFGWCPYGNSTFFSWVAAFFHVECWRQFCPSSNKLGHSPHLCDMAKKTSLLSNMPKLFDKFYVLGHLFSHYFHDQSANKMEIPSFLYIV